jgi:hypothetical protein
MQIEQAIIIDIETAPRSPGWIKDRGFLTPPRSFRRRENHIPPEIHWNEWHDETAQLDPARSWVCAVGLMLPSRGSVLLFADTVDDETELLGHLSKLLAGNLPFAGEDCLTGKNKIVGHNHLSFDIPYLLMRATLCGNPQVATALIDQLQSGLRHQSVLAKYLDTKEAWQREFKGLTANSSSLDSIAATLGLPIKPGNGKDFYSWDREQQSRYLTHDLHTTGEIARRLFSPQQLQWEEVEQMQETDIAPQVTDCEEGPVDPAHGAHHDLPSNSTWHALAMDVARACWMSPETQKYEPHPALVEVVAEAISGWMDTAASSHRNMEYYRDLLRRCGESIGEAAFTDDAGGKHTDVICAQVPGLVADLVSKIHSQGA